MLINRFGQQERLNMSVANIKQAARELVDQLPENATWEDLMREIYVRKAIDAGLKDMVAGRVTPVDEVRQKYGLDG